MKHKGIQLRSGGCWVLPPVTEDTAETAGSTPLEAPAPLSWTAREPVHATLTLYDTWQWDLWHGGYLLVGDGRRLQVVNGEQQALGQVPLAEPPRFAKDQPPGVLADVVAPRIGIRAALPVVQLDVDQREWVLTNADDKVVVRVVEQDWPGGMRTLSLVPLRGYEDEAEQVRAHLPQAQMSDAHPLRLGLQAAGVVPRTWTNKPLFVFDDDMPAHAAIADMVRTMLDLARETEAGIIGDLDTEFLHDYRVLIRKARSLLALTNGVFDPGSTRQMKDAFRVIGKRTNELRDLDVHMMEHDEQVARVPVALRAGLEPLFESLVKRRSEVQRAVAKALKSAAYQRQVEALSAKIPTAPPGPKGNKPVRRLADRKLATQLSTVLKHGRAIRPETPAEAVHALRIECKKLRYLLEVFRHLYGEDRITPTVRGLKRLQDVLGTFNDRCVQQEALLSWVAKTPSVPRMTAVSVGALLGALAAEQANARAKVEEAFTSFDRPEVRRALRRRAPSKAKEVA